MKRETAIRKVRAVRDRLRAVSGLIATPGAPSEAYRIRRAWVFGSVAKGAAEPGDVDILIEGWVCGRRGVRITDQAYLRRYGIGLALNPWIEACKYLRGRMTMVRFHDSRIDGDYGDIASTKILIYPRDDFSGRSP